MGSIGADTLELKIRLKKSNFIENFEFLNFEFGIFRIFIFFKNSFFYFYPLYSYNSSISGYDEEEGKEDKFHGTHGGGYQKGHDYEAFEHEDGHRGHNRNDFGHTGHGRKFHRGGYGNRGREHHSKGYDKGHDHEGRGGDWQDDSEEGA